MYIYVYADSNLLYTVEKLSSIQALGVKRHKCARERVIFLTWIILTSPLSLKDSNRELTDFGGRFLSSAILPYVETTSVSVQVQFDQCGKSCETKI